VNNLSTLAAMLPLSIKFLIAAFPFTVLSSSIDSLSASKFFFNKSNILSHFPHTQTVTLPSEKLDRQLIIADANSDRAAILSVLELQFKALNESNVEAYMATIDPSSPAFEPTKNVVAPAFARGGLKYVMNQFEVVSISGNTALVRVDQTTTKIQDFPFRNNRMVFLHKFTKSNGSWKMFSTEVEKVEFLN
jgi:hypothetical protein